MFAGQVFFPRSSEHACVFIIMMCLFYVESGVYRTPERWSLTFRVVFERLSEGFALLCFAACLVFQVMPCSNIGHIYRASTAV